MRLSSPGVLLFLLALFALFAVAAVTDEQAKTFDGANDVVQMEARKTVMSEIFVFQARHAVLCEDGAIATDDTESFEAKNQLDTKNTSPIRQDVWCREVATVLLCPLRTLLKNARNDAHSNRHGQLTLTGGRDSGTGVI